MKAISYYRGNSYRNKFKDMPRLKTGLMAKLDKAIESVMGKKDGIVESFVSIMMKVSIIKLSVAMVILILMTTLFLTHLHTLTPITLQFSKWVSSPLAGFIVFILAIKFIGISVGITLTILSVKQTTLGAVLLSLRESLKLKLSYFLRRKVQPQANGFIGLTTS